MSTKIIPIRILIVIACIAALIPLPAYKPVRAQSADLLPNGGFENGTASWSGISDSDLTGDGTHSGSKALKITGAVEAQSDWIHVVPGQSYTLTAWYKWANYSGSNWGFDRVRVVNYDWSEAAASNNLHSNYAQNEWSQISLSFTPSSDQVLVDLGQYGPQDAVEIYFDDVSLPGSGAEPTQPAPTSDETTPTEAPTPTETPAAPSEFITNGDFEDGLAPWENLNDSDLVSDGAQSGSRAVKISGEKDIRQGWFSVTPGKTYVLTAWYKWARYEGTQWGTDRVRIVDSSWADVASLSNLHSRYPKNQWVKLALTFTPQTDSVLLSFGQNGPQDAVEFYFDHFGLREKNGADQPPQVSVSASTTVGTSPLSVDFTCNASDPDGAIQSFNWDFGDGSADTANNPTHIYQGSGSFTATCTVFDNEDSFTTASTTIDVSGGSTQAGPLEIQSPTSDDSYTTGDSSITLGGTAQSAKTVSWDNVDTDQAGVLDGAPINTWQTPSIPLKPGRNELLITAMNDQGQVSTDRLVVTRQVSSPSISNVHTSGNSVNVYDKYEIQFDLDTVADNYFYQYDANPPAGVKAGSGVTAEAVLTSPSGKTLVQPAFYSYEASRDGGDGFGHFSATNRAYWTVRFSPAETGTYQVSLRVQDASGTANTSVGSFTANSPSKPGFVQVSKNDSRYFEFSNGSLFYPLGPANGPSYDSYKDSGLNMQRQWMAGLGAYSTNFARWMSTAQQMGNEGFDSHLSFREHYPGHELSQELSYPDGRRIWIGWSSGEPYTAVLKANTDYLVKARIKTANLSGPADSSIPYGFMIKYGGWPSDNVEADLRGTPSLIPPVTQNNDWFTVVSKVNTGDNVSGSYLYFFLDNVTAGSVFIDEISIKEINGDGSLGGEQVVDSRADLHAYVEPRAAAAIDYQVQQAENNGIYLKYVVMDKRDWVPNHLTSGGAWSDTGDGYYQGEGTKAYWLQTQWWRYLIARWGYSTNIQSWELNNEGSPDDAGHYAAAQRFAKYMHANDPNRHLVTTSFWCCWRPAFWGDNTNYPDVDYADIHEYVSDPAIGYDVVGWELNNSLTDFAAAVNKPIMMGEFGIGSPGQALYNDLTQPNDGDWYHDMLWSQLNPGALSNPNDWWTEQLNQFDYRQVTKAFYNFVRTLDLNKGGYSDAAASVDNGNVYAIGQKNAGSGQAYLWIQNKAHTWRNVMGIDNPSPINAQSAAITLQMAANTNYTLEWWNTASGTVTGTEGVRSDKSGNLRITVSNLQSDVAVKISTKAPEKPSKGKK